MNTELTISRFEQAVEKYPGNTALVFLGQEFSFARLLEMTKRFAAGLAGLGIGKGDRIMIYLPNCPQLILTFLAAQKIGAVTVLVSPIYTSHELEYMISDSGAKAVVCQDTNFGYVQEVLDKTCLEHILVTNLLDLVSWPKRALASLFDKAPTGTVKGGEETIPFKRLLRSPPTPPPVTIDPMSDLSYILYTGGTTGQPKGVPGNHAGQTSYVNDICEHVFKGYAQEGGDVYIAINPLFHIMALGLFMALGLNMGNTTVLMPQPQVDAILEAIQRHRVRWILGVPALYRMILENDRQEFYDLSSLKYCYCGGDVLPREVLARWKARTGVSIYQVYGSTEAGHVTYSRLDGGDPAPMSIGVPLPSRRTMIVDPETLEPVPAGESGEMLVTSDHSLKAYLNKPEDTAASFVEMKGEIYYRTGDYVKQGGNNEIIYVERSADILKHKGYRVSASEVEAVLQDHPVVVGACVVGVPDRKVGERVKAIVVMKEDAKGVGANELISYCRERLASYKVPSYIEFRDMLPKSKVGKLLRREIRDEEKRKLAKTKRAGAKPAAVTAADQGVEDMEFKQVVQSRRSVRAFTDDPVSDEQIEELITTATWAPSPLHQQPWQFVVIRGVEAKAKVIDVCSQALQKVLNAGGPAWVKKYSFQFLEQAPVLIAVLYDPAKGGLGEHFNQPNGALCAASAAIQNLLLAAEDMGLGSLWFTFFDPKAMCQALNVPDKLEIAGILPIGVPSEAPKAPPRKAPKVFRDSYGQ